MSKPCVHPQHVATTPTTPDTIRKWVRDYSIANFDEAICEAEMAHATPAFTEEQRKERLVLLKELRKELLQKTYSDAEAKIHLETHRETQRLIELLRNQLNAATVRIEETTEQLWRVETAIKKSHKPHWWVVLIAIATLAVAILAWIFPRR
jgi:hypothetical protein